MKDRKGSFNFTPIPVSELDPNNDKAGKGEISDSDDTSAGFDADVLVMTPAGVVIRFPAADAHRVLALKGFTAVGTADGPLAAGGMASAGGGNSGNGGAPPPSRPPDYASAASDADDLDDSDPGEGITPTDVLVMTATGAVILVPFIVAGPLLSLAGFTAVGPAAGSAAAGWMASAGTVSAGGLFATLQSAAMGGYGAPLVAGAVQGVAAGAGGLYAWARRNF